MSIYTPYTYLIGWTAHNKWYYGCQYGKNANPSNLWVTYFTSSTYVEKCRKLYGEPDVIEIRKTFTNKEDALLWEEKVLARMKVVSNDKWLNRHNNGSDFYVDEEVAKKRGAKHKGYKHSEESKKKISEAMKRPRKSKGKRVFTEEWRRKLSEARKRNVGEKNSTYGKTWKWSKETLRP